MSIPELDNLPPTSISRHTLILCTEQAIRQAPALTTYEKRAIRIAAAAVLSFSHRDLAPLTSPEYSQGRPGCLLVQNGLLAELGGYAAFGAACHQFYDAFDLAIEAALPSVKPCRTLEVVE